MSGASLEKSRMGVSPQIGEGVLPVELPSNQAGVVSAESLPNQAGLLFKEFQDVLTRAKQNVLDPIKIEHTRTIILGIFAHAGAAGMSEADIQQLHQNIDILKLLVDGPLVLTLDQRIDQEAVTTVEEEVDFTNRESRTEYFDELGQRVILLRKLTATYFTRFESANIPWPEYNKIGLQKMALAEAFFKGNFTNQFNRLVAAIDTQVDVNIATLVDNLNRSYDIVEDQIAAVNTQLHIAQEALSMSKQDAASLVPAESESGSLPGIDQTAIRNAARAAFANAGVSPAEAERRIQKSFDAAFVEFKDDPNRLQADVDRIIDNLIVEWENEHRFETATVIPIAEQAPSLVAPDFTHEATRTVLFEGLIHKVAETKVEALSIFDTVDVAYELRDLSDFKRIGRSHIKQLDFFETQFKKSFTMLPTSTDIPLTIHRLNVTYAEIERHIDVVRTYVGRIIEARQAFISAHKTEGEVIAINEDPLEMAEAIRHFNQSKVLLAERLRYFTAQANRFGFSLANSRTYLDVMARQGVLVDISSYQDSDSEVSKNILKRYQQKLDQLFTLVDGLEIDLHSFVSGQLVPPVDIEGISVSESPDQMTATAVLSPTAKVSDEGSFSMVPPQESGLKTEPMAEQLPAGETDQIIFDAEVKLRGIQFISTEEKETTNFFLTSYKNAKLSGASPEVLLKVAKNVQDNIDSLTQTIDANYLRERAEQIKRFVETAGKINFEALGTITAMYENFVRIANAQAAQGSPDHVNVREAYFNLERMVTDSSIHGYQGYRELNMRPLHEEWRAAKHEHEWRSKTYEENLQLHYQALQNRQFGFAKLQYLTQKAFSIKPELPPALLQERADSFAATARYSKLAFEMRTNRTDVSTSESDQENEILDRYKRLLARTLVANTFQTQLEIQKRALTDDEKAPVSRIVQLLRDNRKTLSIAGAAIIGGVTGGMVGGAAAIFRVLGAGAASAVSAMYVGDAFDKKIGAAERLSDDEFAQSIEAIEQMLTQQSLTQEDLVGIHEALSAIYARVDSVKRQKIIAIIGTAIVVGGSIGFSVGTGAGMALGSLGVPGSAISEALPTSSHDITNTAPVVVDTAPLQPNTPTIPPTPIFTTVDTRTIPTVAVVPLQNAPSFANTYGHGAENIPLDPGITLPESATVPVPELPPTEPDVIESVTELPLALETVPHITHTLVANDNLTHLVKRYGDELLNTLSVADQNTVIAELVARVNHSPELLSAAGIESGDANLLFASTVATPHTIVMDPLLAELKVVVTEKIRADLGAGLQSVPTTELSAAVPDTPDTIATEVLQVEAEVPIAETVPLLQHRITQFTDSYPGGPRAFADNFSTWVDSIQGVHPGVFSRIFTGPGVDHADAFSALKEMPVHKMRELSNLTEAARTARLSQPDLNILPSDFNKWTMLMRKWSMIPGLITDDAVTLDILAQRAYAESMLS